MAVLVTGGGGYIGRWLAHELAGHGERTVAVDRQWPAPDAQPPLREDTIFVEGDVTERATLERAADAAEIGAIIHLAGIVTMGCERDPNLCMRVNFGSTHHALEVARTRNIPRVVLASTDGVYGPDVPQPIREDGPVLPRTWYGQSKVLAEQLGLYYERRWGLDFRVARMAAIVGAHRNAASGSATMWTSLILERAALGEPYDIDVDEGAARPVCYVKDAVRALATLALAPSAPSRIYNISTTRASAVELVEIARRRFPDAQLQFKPEPTLAAVARLSYDWRMSTERAETDLGWRPAFSLESMANDVMDTVRANAERERQTG